MPWWSLSQKYPARWRICMMGAVAESPVPKERVIQSPTRKNLYENVSLWTDLKEKSSFFFLEQEYPEHKMTVMQMVDKEELTYGWVFPLQQSKRGVMIHIWLERVMLVRH